MAWTGGAKGARWFRQGGGGVWAGGRGRVVRVVFSSAMRLARLPAGGAAAGFRFQLSPPPSPARGARRRGLRQTFCFGNGSRQAGFRSAYVLFSWRSEFLGFFGIALAGMAAAPSPGFARFILRKGSSYRVAVPSSPNRASHYGQQSPSQPQQQSQPQRQHSNARAAPNAPPTANVAANLADAAGRSAPHLRARSGGVGGGGPHVS